MSVNTKTRKQAILDLINDVYKIAPQKMNQICWGLIDNHKTNKLWTAGFSTTNFLEICYSLISGEGTSHRSSGIVAVSDVSWWKAMEKALYGDTYTIEFKEIP